MNRRSAIHLWMASHREFACGEVSSPSSSSKILSAPGMFICQGRFHPFHIYIYIVGIYVLYFNLKPIEGISCYSLMLPKMGAE